MASRNTFKGNQKNRNKKISKEERKLRHTKKVSKREYDVKVIARDDLKVLDGKEVSVEGILSYLSSNDPFKPVLVTKVTIDGVFYDHLWLDFSVPDRKKLRLCGRGLSILFTGVVYSYVKRQDRQLGVKYGVRSVALVKE